MAPSEGNLRGNHQESLYTGVIQQKPPARERAVPGTEPCLGHHDAAGRGYQGPGPREREPATVVTPPMAAERTAQPCSPPSARSSAPAFYWLSPSQRTGGSPAPGNSFEMLILGSTLDLLNQKHRAGPSICIFQSPPGEADICPSLRLSNLNSRAEPRWRRWSRSVGTWHIQQVF